MSEYTQRYQGNSHQQLYDGLMAGKPEQIEGVATQWAELKGILDGLGRELSGDLDKLANTWTGSAGREFHRRLSLIVAHTDALGEGMAGIKQGLTMMADHLRAAHKKAESPEETDDNDKAIGGAIKGGAVFGLTGADRRGHRGSPAGQGRAGEGPPADGEPGGRPGQQLRHLRLRPGGRPAPARPGYSEHRQQGSDDATERLGHRQGDRWPQHRHSHRAHG